jgi:hypothetical protein
MLLNRKEKSVDCLAWLFFRPHPGVNHNIRLVPLAWEFTVRSQLDNEVPYPRTEQCRLELILWHRPEGLKMFVYEPSNVTRIH